MQHEGKEFEESRSHRCRISEAEHTLDHVIGFARNSDEKTEIALTMAGVMLTLIFTMTGQSIMEMIHDAWINPDLVSASFAILFIIIMVFAVYGIFRMINVLVPRISPERYADESLFADSNIFFGTISENGYAAYKDRMDNYSDSDYLNDLWSQIYINSRVATVKYRNFTIGLKVTIPALLIMLGIVMIFGQWIL